MNKNIYHCKATQNLKCMYSPAIYGTCASDDTRKFKTYITYIILYF